MGKDICKECSCCNHCNSRHETDAHPIEWCPLDPEVPQEKIEEYLRSQGAPAGTPWDREIAYYKELARRWETACHDYKSFCSGTEVPLSYSAAAAFAKEHIVPAEEPGLCPCGLHRGHRYPCRFIEPDQDEDTADVLLAAALEQCLECKYADDDEPCSYDQDGYPIPGDKDNECTQCGVPRGIKGTLFERIDRYLDGDDSTRLARMFNRPVASAALQKIADICTDHIKSVLERPPSRLRDLLPPGRVDADGIEHVNIKMGTPKFIGKSPPTPPEIPVGDASAFSDPSLGTPYPEEPKTPVPADFVPARPIGEALADCICKDAGYPMVEVHDDCPVHNVPKDLLPAVPVVESIDDWYDGNLNAAKVSKAWAKSIGQLPIEKQKEALDDLRARNMPGMAELVEGHLKLRAKLEHPMSMKTAAEIIDAPGITGVMSEPEFIGKYTPASEIQVGEKPPEIPPQLHTWLIINPGTGEKRLVHQQPVRWKPESARLAEPHEVGWDEAVYKMTAELVPVSSLEGEITYVEVPEWDKRPAPEMSVEKWIAQEIFQRIQRIVPPKSFGVDRPLRTSCLDRTVFIRLGGVGHFRIVVSKEENHNE